MSKKSNTITMSVEELNNVIAQAVAQALAQQKPSKRATGNAQPKAEKVAFTNSKGETKMVSKAQAAAWEKWSNGKANSHTREELAEMSEGFKFTKAMDAYIKANPSCSKKDFNEKFGFKGMTKKMLHDRKLALNVR